MPGTKHTCNPNNPGMARPFGKKAPRGECPRCDELHDGAEPRSLGWVDARNTRQFHDEQRARDIANHDCVKARCSSVCTAFDW
jgi:hypothetical protein